MRLVVSKKAVISDFQEDNRSCSSLLCGWYNISFIFLFIITFLITSALFIVLSLQTCQLYHFIHGPELEWWHANFTPLFQPKKIPICCCSSRSGKSWQRDRNVPVRILCMCTSSIHVFPDPGMSVHLFQVWGTQNREERQEGELRLEELRSLCVSFPHQCSCVT